MSHDDAKELLRVLANIDASLRMIAEVISSRAPEEIPAVKETDSE